MGPCGTGHVLHHSRRLRPAPPASASCPPEVNAGSPAAAVTAGGHPARPCVTSGRGTGILGDSGNHGAGHRLGSTLPWGFVCVTSSTVTRDPRAEPWALAMEGRGTARRAPSCPARRPLQVPRLRSVLQAPGRSSVRASEAGARAGHQGTPGPFPLPGPGVKTRSRGRQDGAPSLGAWSLRHGGGPASPKVLTQRPPNHPKSCLAKPLSIRAACGSRRRGPHGRDRLSARSSDKILLTLAMSQDDQPRLRGEARSLRPGAADAWGRRRGHRGQGTVRGQGTRGALGGAFASGSKTFLFTSR